MVNWTELLLAVASVDFCELVVSISAVSGFDHS